MSPKILSKNLSYDVPSYSNTTQRTDIAETRVLKTLPIYLALAEVVVATEMAEHFPALAVLTAADSYY